VKFVPIEFIVKSVLPSLLRLSAAFVQFAATLIIARTLGDVGASPFFYWSSILMSVAVFSTFGLDRILLQKVPTLHGGDLEIGELIARTRVIVVAVALVVGLAISLFAITINANRSSPLYWATLIPSGIVGIALCRVNAEALKGMAHPNLAILHRQLGAGIGFLLLLLLFLPILTAKVALVFYVLCFLVAGTLAYKGPGFGHLEPGYQKSDSASVKSSLRAGLPLCIGSVFLSLSFIVPLTILERTNPPETVSYVTTAYRIFILINLLAVASYASELPALSKAGYAMEHGSSIRTYLKMIFNTCTIFVVPVLLVMFFAEWVMAMFGSSFVSAAPVLQAFMVVAVISLILGPTDDLLLMNDMSNMIAISAGLQLIVVAIAGVILIPGYNAIGMAATLGIGIVVQKIFSLIMYWRYKNTRVYGTSL